MRILCLILALGLASLGYAEESKSIVEAPSGVQIPTILGQILGLILSIAGAALSFLIPWVIHKLAVKLNVDKIAGLEQMATDAANKGIHFAEAWAAGQQTKPSGSQKFDAAMKYIQQIMGAPFVKEYTEDKLKKLVESTLAEHEMGPAAK